MIDPRILREQPDLVRQAIRAKGSDCDLDAVLAADAAWRAKTAEVERLRSQQKAANQEMARLPKGSPEFLAKVKELKAVAAEVKAGEAQLKELEATWRQLALTVPNLPHPSVPVAPDPSGNITHRTW